MNQNSVPIMQSIPPELLKIGKRIREQDNRFTDQPMFVVQEKREYISDSDYYNCRIEWRRNSDGDHAEVDEARAKRLESIYQARMEIPEGYDRFEMMPVWETVVACFTEQGCLDYLAANRHNHTGELRIYADGSFRNFEFRALRNWLMTLPEPDSLTDQPSVDQEKQKRVADVNAVILAISRHGRRFFWSENKRTTAQMSLDQSGKVEFRCEHTGQMIPVSSNHGAAMLGFSHGGTLRSLVIAFGEYIQAGEKLHIDNIGLPRAFGSTGYVWGYSKEAVVAVLAEVKHLPLFYGEPTA